MCGIVTSHPQEFHPSAGAAARRALRRALIGATTRRMPYGVGQPLRRAAPGASLAFETIEGTTLAPDRLAGLPSRLRRS